MNIFNCVYYFQNNLISLGFSWPKFYINEITYFEIKKIAVAKLNVYLYDRLVVAGSAEEGFATFAGECSEVEPGRWFLAHSAQLVL